MFHSHTVVPAHFASPGRLSFGKDATQSPYSGWQNVVNSRNVRNCFFVDTKKLSMQK
jgi:hypothetical protein